MRLDYRDGLLFIAIEITYKGRTKRIENIVIDTGAAESLISPDAVDDIDILPSMEDDVVTLMGVGGNEHHSFVKKIDVLRIGDFKLTDIDVDFGIIDPLGRINGLIGLDVLINAGVKIDLKEFTLT